MNHAELVKVLSQEFANAAAIVGGFGDSKPNRDRVDRKVKVLHAAIDAMQTALDESERQKEDWIKKCCVREEEISVLRRMLAGGMRKDADRYEFLRKDFSPVSLNIDGKHCWVYRRNFSLLGATLNEAIDKALSEEVKVG